MVTITVPGTATIDTTSSTRYNANLTDSKTRDDNELNSPLNESIISNMLPYMILTIAILSLCVIILCCWIMIKIRKRRNEDKRKHLDTINFAKESEITSYIENVVADDDEQEIQNTNDPEVIHINANTTTAASVVFERSRINQTLLSNYHRHWTLQ